MSHFPGPCVTPEKFILLSCKCHTKQFFLVFSDFPDFQSNNMSPLSLNHFPVSQCQVFFELFVSGFVCQPVLFSVGASVLPDSEIANFQTDFILQLKSTGV